MKKGMALEGYIMPDKTIRPLNHYDDTELREKIQKNADEIDNLKSRVTSVEGGVHLSSDGTITPGNLAEFSDNHTIKDSGKKKSDFVEANEIKIEDDFVSYDQDGTIKDSGCSKNSFLLSKPSLVLNVCLNNGGTIEVTNEEGEALSLFNIGVNKAYVEIYENDTDDNEPLMSGFGEIHETNGALSRIQNIILDDVKVTRTFTRTTRTHPFTPGAWSYDKYTTDTISSGNKHAITSGSVYTALVEKEDTFQEIKLKKNSDTNVFSFEETDALKSLIVSMIESSLYRKLVKVSFGGYMSSIPSAVIELFKSFGCISVQNLNGTVVVSIYTEGYRFEKLAIYDSTNHSLTFSSSAMTVTINTFIADALPESES